ncbi:MAG: AraC family transcriptional regulator [Xanthobacteraceae bacterium]|nr:AraC family transcriptional regulator [Xanthobacteraceae bacterium]
MIQTRDPNEMRRVAISVFGAATFDTNRAEDFEAKVNYLQFGGIGIGFSAYDASAADARASVAFPESDFARVHMALRGIARLSLNRTTNLIDPASLCVCSSGRSSEVVYQPGYQQLFFRVGATALNDTLIAILGARPQRAIVFDPVIPADRDRSLMLRQLMLFIGQQLSPSPLELPEFLQREIQSVAAAAFLFCCTNNFSEVLDQRGPAAATYQVRLAEDYIESHWNEPITIEQLAALTQVSVRSLYLAFQRVRGYSPKAFVKMVRMRKAREKLLDPSTASVMSVALACGFQNLGHFASGYRMQFGETPSQTLASARRRL